MIARKDLEAGCMYRCEARNFTYGMWTGKHFLYIREKFGGYNMAVELYWKDDNRFGTVKPLEKV